ncbi:hypothetical protein RHGRI_000143 [Rhododendron griersonianum]|uniref:Secreted protein n=1 Tax=Rhododendron griersonianum TaxID=479676 RepID=A0AAV6LIN9_9ERIC|nr:hypothetical protein RHGRI_000143 [Rhododendron griersonianum]
MMVETWWLRCNVLQAGLDCAPSACVEMYLLIQCASGAVKKRLGRILHRPNAPHPQSKFTPAYPLQTQRGAIQVRPDASNEPQAQSKCARAHPL